MKDWKDEKRRKEAKKGRGYGLENIQRLRERNKQKSRKKSEK